MISDVPRGPRGQTFNRNEAARRREELTTSSRCPFCGRRCLKHLGNHWQCQACDRTWTGRVIPPDPLAGVRALIAKAKNVAEVAPRKGNKV